MAKGAIKSQRRIKRIYRYNNLGDHKLGNSLWKSSSLMRQDHFEHVPLQALHHDEDALRGLEHPLQVHDARMRQVLEDGHFVLQLRLLLRREAQLVYHLFTYSSRAQPKLYSFINITLHRFENYSTDFNIYLKTR